MNRKLLIISAVVGALAVGLGAFGAHGLESKLEADRLDIYKTANLYHHIFALFLLVLAFLSKDYGIRLAFFAALSGIICFSGSLYLLACKPLFVIIPTAILGPITPLGGLLFILAWMSLLIVKKAE